MNYMYIVELFNLFIVSSFLSEGSCGENKTLLAKINFGYRPIEQLYLSSKEFCFKYIYYIHILFFRISQFKQIMYALLKYCNTTDFHVIAIFIGFVGNVQ